MFLSSINAQKFTKSTHAAVMHIHKAKNNMSKKTNQIYYFVIIGFAYFCI